MSKAQAKSKKPSPPAPAKAKAKAGNDEPSLVVGALELLLSVVPVALYLFAYERTLLPIYASVPTKYLLKRAFIASVALAALVPVKLGKNRLLFLLSVVLAIAPKATYHVAVWTARKGNPVLGPAATHLLTLAPVAYLSTIVASHIGVAQSFDESSSRPVSAIICSLAASGFLQAQIAKVPFIDSIADSHIFLFLAWLACTLGLVVQWNKQSTSKGSDAIGPKHFLVLGVLGALFAGAYPILKSPVLPHPLKQPYLHPDFPLVIHSSVQSVTGLISVGEALPPPKFNGEPDDEMHSVRWLRADHSILGGVWMGAKIGVIDDTPPLEDAFGTMLGDSIYSTFVLQEAVRMVNSTAKAKKGDLNNALIIGLGTGISATAFNRHGISTTIVEIDPAVYDAARTYFGLPDPGEGKVFLEDARGWVSKRQAELAIAQEPELFDFVVHDCFSGGGVPQHIFTVQFWQALKAIMHEDGILVVNFAGQPKSNASRAITLTLEKVFGQCRAFHDSMEPIPVERYETEFINVVFICTSSKAPLTFRNSRHSDYLGSPLRQHILRALPTRELNLNVVKGEAAENERLSASLILTDAHNPLGKWQEDQGFHHWTLMRQVLKDIFWETY